MALILNVKSITWHAEDETPDEDIPPTSFQIELSDQWIIDYLTNEFSDAENPMVQDVIEDKYPFLYEGLNFEINQVN